MRGGVAALPVPRAGAHHSMQWMGGELEVRVNSARARRAGECWPVTGSDSESGTVTATTGGEDRGGSARRALRRGIIRRTARAVLVDTNW